jgi:heat shock protein HslJ
MRITVLLSLVTGLAIAAGCMTAAAPAALDGRTFLSTQVMDGGADRPLVPGTRIRLTFRNGTDLGASAGCNTIGGSYRVTNGVLVFEGGGMTEMGCDEPRHAQDEWLAGFLASQPTAALSGNELVLTSGQVTVRLLDEEVANPDLPLVGPVWTVDTIVEGDVALGMPGAAVATLQFQPDGCNEGSASVTVEGSSLRFGPIALTRRACEPPADQIERGILAVLQSETVAFEITANTLTLTGADRGLGLRGG